VAFVVLHEVVGHAGTAVLLGEDVRGLATTTAHIHDFYQIDHVVSRIGRWGFRLISAGGPMMNYITAAIALLLLMGNRVRSATGRYFLWWFASLSLVQQAFWMAMQPLLNQGGDWSAFLVGLHPPLVWRLIVTAAGIGLLFIGVWVPLRLWRPGLSSEFVSRRRAVRTLAGLPIVASFILQVLSVLWGPLSSLRYGLAITTLSFVPVGLWFLIIRRSARWADGRRESSGPIVPFSRTWIAVAVVLSLAFAAWLGPGIGSFQGHPMLEG
jgi:hypothetical protein